jgi:hypothetical protein
MWFDDGGYVGFDLGSFELGPNSFTQTLKVPIAYMGVQNVEEAIELLLSEGARVLMGPVDVGGGIIVADIASLYGEVTRVIFNPHFRE